MKIKIVNKRKFIMMCLILVILVSIVLMGINHTYSKTEVSYKEEFIYEGDTLWSISERELKENKYYKGNDIRNIVSELKNINNVGWVSRNLFIISFSIFALVGFV